MNTDIQTNWQPAPVLTKHAPLAISPVDRTALGRFGARVVSVYSAGALPADRAEKQARALQHSPLNYEPTIARMTAAGHAEKGSLWLMQGADAPELRFALDWVTRWAGVVVAQPQASGWVLSNYARPHHGDPNGWTRELFGGGWCTSADLRAYGCRAGALWVYAVTSCVPILPTAPPRSDCRANGLSGVPLRLARHLVAMARASRGQPSDVGPS